MTLHKAFELFITISLIIATYNGFLNLTYLQLYYIELESSLGIGWGIFCLVSGFLLGLIPILNLLMVWNYVWHMNEMVDSAVKEYHQKE